MFFSSFLLAIFRGLTVIDIDHPDLRFPYHLSISLSIYWFLYTEYSTEAEFDYSKWYQTTSELRSILHTLPQFIQGLPTAAPYPGVGIVGSPDIT